MSVVASPAPGALDELDQLGGLVIGEGPDRLHGVTLEELRLLIGPTSGAVASFRNDLPAAVNAVDEDRLFIGGFVLDAAGVPEDPPVLVFVSEMAVEALHSRYSVVRPARSVGDIVPGHVHVSAHPGGRDVPKGMRMDPVPTDSSLVGELLHELTGARGAEGGFRPFSVAVVTDAEHRRVRVVIGVVLVEPDPEVLLALDDRKRQRVDTLLTLTIPVRGKRRVHLVEIDAAALDLAGGRDSHARVGEELDECLVSRVVGHLAEQSNLGEVKDLRGVNRLDLPARDRDVLPPAVLAVLVAAVHPVEEDPEDSAVVVVAALGDLELRLVGFEDGIHVFEAVELDERSRRTGGRATQCRQVGDDRARREPPVEPPMVGEVLDGLLVSLVDVGIPDVLVRALELAGEVVGVVDVRHGSPDGVPHLRRDGPRIRQVVGGKREGSANPGVPETPFFIYDSPLPQKSNIGFSYGSETFATGGGSVSRGPGRPPAPRDELLEDIRELADLLGGRPLLKHVNEWGRWSRPTYYEHFGSWTAALEEAGVSHLEKVSLEVPSEIDRPAAYAVDLPTDVLLEDVERVAEALGRMPKRSVYSKIGLYPADEIAERFYGTWFLVSKELGYEPPGGGSAWTAARLERMDPEDAGLSPVGDRKIADGGDR